MKISYSWLQSFFDKKLPKPEKLAELLTMHSFEVESVEKIGRDYVLDIDILPNRAHDCLSHYGIAREAAAILNTWKSSFQVDLETGFPSEVGDLRSEKEKAKFWASVKSAKSNAKLNIKVEEPELCRRYIGRIIKGVKVRQSPKWLRDRLEAIGQKSINNIVDATNYVMFEFGQPLHAFDADKVDGGVIVRKAKAGEKITTLDGQEVKLDKNVLVITDDKEPLAVAGIKGGKKAEVGEKTKNIILEAANFEPVNIRKTSRKIGIRTESSVRFENEITPELAEKAMDRVTEIILGSCLATEPPGGLGGPAAKWAKVGAQTDIYPKKANGYNLGVHPKDVSKLLGVEIGEKDIIVILERLGFEIKKRKDDLLRVVVPFERLDVKRKEDLIEEIARIYGYEKIPAKLPEEILLPPKRNDNFFYADIIRNILTGSGFSEVYNYSFNSNGSIEIVNPIARDKKYLKVNLLDGLKKTAKENLRYFPSVKIFEIGKIFPAGGETISLVALSSNASFYEMKGIIEMMLDKIGITDAWFDDSSGSETEYPEKVADIRIGNTSVGVIDHTGFEINFETLVRLATEEVEYRPISKYPAVKRDISVFVPLKTKVVEVLDIIENTAGMLLIDTDLFDIYEIPDEDRKSFAFHLVFQSPQKTLSEEEINTLMNKIMDALDANVEWEVRR